MISIADFGASTSAQDNTAAIQAAINAAKAQHTTVEIPVGNFKHAGVLKLDGVQMVGHGDSSVLTGTNPTAEAVMLSGDGAGISSLKLAGPGGARQTTYDSCAVTALKATNFTIDHVTIDHPSGAGMHISGSSGGKITNNSLSYTGADSIHMSNYEGPNHDLEVSGNKIDHGGDDGIAVVSYSSGQASYNINVHDNAVTDQLWGRGYSVVGGHDIQIHDNYYNNNQANLAGVYISAEAEWNTLPVSNVQVSHNVIANAGGNQGSIQIYASSGPVSNVTADGNDIYGSKNVNILMNGSGGESGITIANNNGYGSQALASDQAGANAAMSGNATHAATAAPTLAQWLDSHTDTGTVTQPLTSSPASGEAPASAPATTTPAAPAAPTTTAPVVTHDASTAAPTTPITTPTTHESPGATNQAHESPAAAPTASESESSAAVLPATLLAIFEQNRHEASATAATESAELHVSAVYRLFDTATGDHFYTSSATEKTLIRETLPTYKYEGVGWASPDKSSNTVDVFRFYDAVNKQHFFTGSTAERDQIIKNMPNYHYEGIAFQSYANKETAGSGAITLERFFNTQTNVHHYAASAQEAYDINHGSAGVGWIDEGPSLIVHVRTDGLLLQ